MSTNVQTQASTSKRRWWRIPVRHYLEMVLAMAVAMAVVGTARSAVGWNVDAVDHPTIAYLLMAVDMSIGMVVVMRWRRHSWRHTAEMCAAMFAPLPIVALLSDGDGGHGAMLAAHILMLALMLAIMIWRRDTYLAHHEAAHAQAPHGHPSQQIR